MSEKTFPVSDCVAPYHGNDIKKGKTFFEGWYFKFAQKDSKNPIALIIANCKSNEEKYSQSFIHIIWKEKCYFFKYGVENFSASSKEFDFKISSDDKSKNFVSFKMNKLELDIDECIKGSITIKDFKGWPITRFSKGAMGWVGLLPCSCNHGVVTFNSEISGTLEIFEKDQKTPENIDFKEGRLYIEKDWGSTFPFEYIWFQSHEFSDGKGKKIEDGCVMGGIARFEVLGISLNGFLVALQLEKNKLITFTAYNLDSLEKKIDDNSVSLILENSTYILQIIIKRKEGVLLFAPYLNRLLQCVNESITSSLMLTLKEKSSQKIVFEAIGKNVGIEISRDLEMEKYSESLNPKFEKKI